MFSGRCHASSPPGQTDGEAWQAFRDRFIGPDGRVIDTGNGSVSHTEGQGWGLLFAVAWDDQPTFDRILDWTARTLRRPGDALHAWRYVPGAQDPVADRNNATDGDLFIAWAMLRAAARWRRPELAAKAVAIARSVLALLVTDTGGRTVLLPGVDGFRKEGGVVVNPSYYAFPVMDALAAALPDPRWAALRRDGLKLLDDGRFGRWGLTCDWVWAGDDGALRPAPGFPPRYGFDAVRVPLYLAWALLPSPARAAARTWWQGAGAEGPGPAWIDVVTNEAAPYPASPGVAAALALAAGDPGFVPPAVTGDMDYYAAALCLLVRVAWRDLATPFTEGRSAAGPR